MIRLLFFTLLFIIFSFLPTILGNTFTPLPTNTPTATQTPLPTNTPTATQTPLPTNTPTATQTPLPTNTPTATQTPLPTNTPTVTQTPLPTNTPMPTNILLYDFDNITAPNTNGWYIVNDGVMGGISQSSLSVAEGVLSWGGIVSLEKNGGFASARVQGRNDWQTGGTNAVQIRVYGDGKLYRFQLYQSGVFYNYEAFFRTADQQWSNIIIPFTEFRALQRGFAVRNPQSIDSSRINGIGLIIQDKQPGQFDLLVDWIRLIKQ